METHSTSVRENFRRLDAGVIDEDSGHDLALIRTAQNITAAALPDMMLGNQPISVAPAKLAADRPDEGLPIATSGYPFGHPVLITTSGSLASSWELQDTSSPFVTADANDIYLGDLSVNGGNSGGPVYSIKDGTVIGICGGFLTALVVDQSGKPFIVGSASAPAKRSSSGRILYYNSGLAEIVPARYILDLLRKNKIKLL